MLDLASIPGAVGLVFSFANLGAILIGNIIGVVVGALPGATATMAIAVMIPITFWFSTEFSLLLLISVYTGGIFGGSITAILLNIPGTPASAATCFDGYPLAKQGRAGEAITVALVASLVGGLVSGIALMFCSPALAALALRFGPPESMMVALFGLTMVASLSSENLAKGLLMGTLGMFIGSIGMEPNTGYPRFTFGSPFLLSGLSVVPILIGVFSVPEVLKMAGAKGWNKPKGGNKLGMSLHVFRKISKTLGVSTLIGLIIGLIPAIGPETATFVGYDRARRMSKEKERFGKGAIEGVAASECANQAVVGTSLAPMFALGIPGSGAAMVLMGGLMIHGLMPGPQLFRENQTLMMTIFIGFIVAQFFMVFVGILAGKFAPLVLRIPHSYLGPIIMVVCMAGTFAVNNNILDVIVMLSAGFVAYYMARAGFSLVPLVLGLVLGPIFEVEMGRTLMLADKAGFISYMGGRPIAAGIFALTAVTVILPLYVKMKGKRDS
jgi:putative tricarboxylic transport membrane protein